jgi:hypothetical protein
MAAKTTLNAKNLEALGRERLAELLIEISAGNAATKGRLRLELAGAQSPGELAKELRKRLTNITRSRWFVDWQGVRALVDDLDNQRRAIVKRVAKADPHEALDLLWRFMALAPSIFERCDDDTGRVIGVFHEACSDIGDVALKAKPNTNHIIIRASVRFRRLRKSRSTGEGPSAEGLEPGNRLLVSDHGLFGASNHAPARTASATALGTIAIPKLTTASAPALAQIIDENASAKVAIRDETCRRRNRLRLTCARYQNWISVADAPAIAMPRNVMKPKNRVDDHEQDNKRAEYDPDCTRHRLGLSAPYASGRDRRRGDQIRCIFTGNGQPSEARPPIVRLP